MSGRVGMCIARNNYHRRNQTIPIKAPLRAFFLTEYKVMFFQDNLGLLCANTILRCQNGDQSLVNFFRTTFTLR